MPLPFILGAAALGAAAFGAKKGYDGYQKHSEADEIVKDAEERYELQRESFDAQEESTTSALTTLGEKELEIGKSFEEFSTLADALLQQLNSGRKNRLEINIPKHDLQKIENYSYTAVGVLGTAAGAGAAGAAAGFAVYGGVMTLGAASTGTAIASLSGAAATNATLAAIGGGSLATGGLGMAGGTAILGASVAAPVLAIAGWAYDKHGEEALSNARKADREADEAIAKLKKAVEQLAQTEEYAGRIQTTLLAIYGQFERYFDTLKSIDILLKDIQSRDGDVDAELAKLNDEIISSIENGYALASIIVNLIMTPIFKIKQVDGQIVEDEDGVPQMEVDEDGSMILNKESLDQSLQEANAESSSF